MHRDYERRLNLEVAQPFTKGLVELNGKYCEALERQQKASEKLGHLDESIALKIERADVIADKPAKSDDSEDTPDSLKHLRKTYRNSLQILTNARDNRSKVVNRDFARELNVLVQTLTKAGKLDDAKSARNQMEALEQDAALVERIDPIPENRGAGTEQAIIHHDINTALSIAKQRHKPVFVIVYDNRSKTKSRLDYLDSFLSTKEERTFLNENFIEAIVSLSSPTVRKFFDQKEVLELCEILLISEDGELVTHRPIAASLGGKVMRQLLDLLSKVR